MSRQPPKPISFSISRLTAQSSFSQNTVVNLIASYSNHKKKQPEGCFFCHTNIRYYLVETTPRVTSRAAMNP